MLYSEVFTLSDKQKDAVFFIRSSFGDYPPLMATNQGKADQWSVGSIALMLSCVFTPADWYNLCNHAVNLP